MMPLLLNMLQNMNGALDKKLQVEAMECEGLLSMLSHGNCGHSRLVVSRSIFCPDANMLRSFSCEYKVFTAVFQN